MVHLEKHAKVEDAFRDKALLEEALRKEQQTPQLQRDDPGRAHVAAAPPSTPAGSPSLSGHTPTPSVAGRHPAGGTGAGSPMAASPDASANGRTVAATASAPIERPAVSPHVSSVAAAHSSFARTSVPLLPEELVPNARLESMEQYITGLEESLFALKQEFSALKAEEALRRVEAARRVEQADAAQVYAEEALAHRQAVEAAAPADGISAASAGKGPEAREAAVSVAAKTAAVPAVVAGWEEQADSFAWQGDATDMAAAPADAEEFPAGQTAEPAFAAEAGTFSPDAAVPGEAVRPMREAPAAPEVSVWKAPEPKEPSFLERAWQGLCSLGLTRFLAASNIWVLAGIGILLIGLVFLVRFAMQFAIFGPEVRLALSAVVGLVLLGIGWKHRERQRELGLILQGGGVGALYLTVVAAVKLYGMLPQALAFVLLVGIVVFSSFLAVAQHAKIMAHVSKIAGFLAPILVSRDSGNYIALFSYYILLNLGIIGVSRFRQWRSLHLTGFIFTVAIGGLWGAFNYTPALFFSVEPFLLAFFAIFTYLALAGSRPSSFSFRNKGDVYIDVPLTLGTPLVFILYQSYIARDISFALAFSSLGLGLLYLGIAWRLWNTRFAGGVSTANAEAEAPEGALPSPEGGGTETARLLREIAGRGRVIQAEIYLAFGIVFANLTLPLALYDLGLYNWGSRLMGLVWCMEGASLFWLGRKNALRLFRGFGIIGLVLGGVYTVRYLLDGAPVYPAGDTLGGIPFAALPTIALSLVIHLMGVGAFLFAANAARVYPLEHELPEQQRAFRQAFTIAGAVWLYASFIFELYGTDVLWEGVLILCTLAGIAAVRLGHRLDWKELTLAPFAAYAPLAVLFVPQMYVALNLLFMAIAVPAPGGGAAQALVLVHSLYTMWSLRSKERRDASLWGTVRFALACNLALPMLMLLSFLPGAPFVWGRLLLLAWPAAFVWGITRFTPTTDAAQTKQWLFPAILPVLFLLIWLGTDMLFLGGSAPLPYVPLLNPMDFGCILCLLLCYRWVQTLHAAMQDNDVLWLLSRNGVWAGAAFILLNVIIARACAMWTDMPFTLSGVMGNGTCQAIMAIFWAAAGFAYMLQGHRLHRRPLWIAGVFLVLADVAKLFLVDLTRMETVWRIVAFMAVGLLLIVIGYYVPLPPAAADKEALKEDS